MREEFLSQLYTDPRLEGELGDLKEQYGVIEKGIAQVLEINSQERVKLGLMKKRKVLEQQLQIIKDQIQEQAALLSE